MIDRLNRALPPNTHTARYLERETTQHSFPELVDAKGRTLGAQVALWPVTVTAGIDPAARFSYRTDLPPGEYFAVNVHVTRNGETFGALQRDHVLPSRDAAERKAAGLVAAARARYAKRAAAGEKL